jgi:hypothetical protein
MLPPDIAKIDYNIYSYLSCINEINIGKITMVDPYLIEIIDAENLTEISQKIDRNYDPSEKIERFSIDMINYYYWFSPFSYCDNDYIKSGECCKNELLSDWEVISNKEYIYKIKDIFAKLGINKNFEVLKEILQREIKKIKND